MDENIPEPKVDPEPDPGNLAGGVDAVDDGSTFPPVPPDDPLAAQMADEELPDEVRRGEDSDSEANIEDPSIEPAD